MSGTLTRAIESDEPGLAGVALELAASRPARSESTACFHCGEPCPDGRFHQAEKTFCCQGCLTVHDLLAESGLGQFYDLSDHPGVRIRAGADREQWAFLDEPSLAQKLLDFTDGKLSRITLHIPAIHCVACVWLLESLFRLHPGIGRSQVNFPRRDAAITFIPDKIALSELVALLVSIGYQPQLTLGELERRPADPTRKRRWLQLGIAGFAFGNIMLFSIPAYLGLDSLTAGPFRSLFGWLSLALAAPVLVYSAADYWRSALLSVRQRILTLDVPIALGLAALYAQSALEIVLGRGEGYLDSLAGLVFFLLCGRAFQNKTHDRIAFDLDYKCFFPLSVKRLRGTAEESVAISDLQVGDRLRLRNGELIPADSRLVEGIACIDYSFVTGESEPVPRQAGDYIYAGGKQVGSGIEVETVKPVSQSYLTSLWNHETFHKQREDSLNTLTNRYSRRFTRLVIGVALGAAVFWVAFGEPGRGLKAFTSVLIVACPCALALAAPFALGTAQRLLARAKVFLKNALVLERLAQVDAIVFDKTGTLTAANCHSLSFFPSLGLKQLGEAEKSRLHRVTRHSTHPYAVRIADWSAPLREPSTQPVRATQRVGSFQETPGFGLVGTADEHDFRLGSRAWLESNGIATPELDLPVGSVTCLAIDGQFRGAFVLGTALRAETDRLLNDLCQRHELALLSGDNERERDRFRSLFGHDARVHFNQSPLDKLGFIRQLQNGGKKVMMVGDGLNDAGALKQSDVGVAVVETAGGFSPASDIILEAGQVPRLQAILSLARRSTRIVRLSFGISALYNLAGISIGAAGILSPLICAILMPLSSISVVLFACGMTRLAAQKEGVG